MTKSNIKIRPAKFKEVIGTGRIGSVFATLDQLKSAFGEPHDCRTECEWESRDNKVRLEWAFVVNKNRNLVFTVYDYKSSEPLGKIKRWNLGGKNYKVKKYISELISVE
jgi:hypothetical protein